MSKESEFLFRFADCFDPPPDGLTLDSPFEELEDFDSLARLSVLAMLDTEYGITVDPAILNECETAEDLYGYVMDIISQLFPEVEEE